MKSDSSHGVLHFDVVVVVGLAVVVVLVVVVVGAEVVVMIGVVVMGGDCPSHLSGSKQGLERWQKNNGCTSCQVPGFAVNFVVEVAPLVFMLVQVIQFTL